MEEQLNAIMKMFNRFKLGNSVFKQNVKINDEFIKDQPNYEQFITKELFQSLSLSLESKFKCAIVKDNNEMSLELLVMKVNDFKSVVEGAIELMPIEAINKIKGIQS